MRDLQDAAFLAQLRKGISDAHVHPTTGYGGNYSIEFLPTEDHGTTHLSVVDNEGNAVALTSTINTLFGSKVISPSTGMMMMNDDDDK